jgi:alkanesulfonate monooxygenase SsuD/methylene tetrahydromethanopterin reductase-like flavin-dependent oxidoreductase (luciferase family)
LELAVHLPLMEFGDEGQSLARLTGAVDAARECGFAAVSANDHFLFQAPWLDGPTALAAVIERSGAMELATTVALVALRGPVPLAKTLAALDLLSDGRVIAGVGPGSSERDYDAIGVAYEERWERFDEAVAILRSLLRDAPPPEACRHYALPGARLAPAARRAGGIPIWIGSWGSKAGLRRVARLGDGWLASAYNTTPDGFTVAKQALSEQLDACGRDPDRFPNALATMWTWVTEDARDADRVLREVLAPMLKRDPDALRDQLCIGPAERCAELLSRYAQAGCERVYLWPLGDEPRQIELAATAVLPAVAAHRTGLSAASRASQHASG